MISASMQQRNIVQQCTTGQQAGSVVPLAMFKSIFVLRWKETLEPDAWGFPLISIVARLWEIFNSIYSYLHFLWICILSFVCGNKTLLRINSAKSLSFPLMVVLYSPTADNTLCFTLCLICIWHLNLYLSMHFCQLWLSFSSDDIHHHQTTPVSALLFVRTTSASSGWEFSNSLPHFRRTRGSSGIFLKYDLSEN